MTRDLAIAEALRGAAPGDQVIIHDERCRCSRRVRARCTCDPLTLVKGAQA